MYRLSKLCVSENHLAFNQASLRPEARTGESCSRHSSLVRRVVPVVAPPAIAMWTREKEYSISYINNVKSKELMCN